MTQPTTPAPVTTPSSSTPPPPSANITRTDGVVGGNGAAATGTKTGTLQPSESTGTAQQQPQGMGGGMTLVFFLMPVMLFVFWYFGSRADKKRRAEHAATLAGLQRNDKVETIGGVLGTIAEITDTEVVIKTDDITNSRVRVRRSAISNILNHAAKSDGVKVNA